MSKHRLFEAQSLISTHQDVTLNETNSHHLANVLRAKVGQEVILFNNSGRDYTCQITVCTKKSVCVKVLSSEAKQNESPLSIHLGQVVSRGEKMEFTLQKSVELGVHAITPLLSTRCGVNLSQERWQKKQQQWQKIIIAACQQCGRTQIPTLHPVLPLDTWLEQTAQQHEAFNLTLDPHSTKRFRDLTPSTQTLNLLIGPEGGFTPEEVTRSEQARFHAVQIGPRILRTETAALATLSALQSRWGDL